MSTDCQHQQSGAFERCAEGAVIYARHRLSAPAEGGGACECCDICTSRILINCPSLNSIGPGVFSLFHSLDVLRITKTGLSSVPDFSMFETRTKAQNSSMFEIRVQNNMLTAIEDGAFKGAVITRLLCKNNFHLKQLGKLAFSGIQEFHYLDLSRSEISELPTEGLINIRQLVLERTPSLKTFPSVFKFSEISVARLTYEHHCCAFRHVLLTLSLSTLTHVVLTLSLSTLRHASKQDPVESSHMEQTGHTSACAAHMSPQPSPPAPVLPELASRLRRSVERLGQLAGALASSLWFPLVRRERGPGPRPRVGVVEGRDGESREESGALAPPTASSNSKQGHWHDKPQADNGTTKWVTCGNFSSPKDYSHVTCTPRPNPFNPCEDVMGYEWLRLFVWLVLLAALGGNLVVMVVLLSARSKLTVPKFLMCNLSFADFLMGLYLLLIASVDVHFLGEYFTHAVSWQNDGGCQVAGFLTVFSSELSVFVLTVITLERWYAISQAIHVNKRLRMRQATCLMLAGWLYASSLAVLPLLGVSGYGAVSICLPMEANDSLDIVYITLLLVFNGIAFTAICGCYISMFLKVNS
ncbi:hypothetical protein EGW08_023463 [Elysia chlorotica]|uniref:G-protein coupled receptors family 1 profile domain-containing protein n=1 Tax=Elysia chlorotica TaxID=188477 RepID=A0A3S0Z3V6_ELYCH|nr:hypothetical protein EGW08_023463 [Elysia chlorotica]